MALRGSRALALLVAITVTACAGLAGIDTSEPETPLPERGELADSSDEATVFEASKPDASKTDAAPAVDAAPPGKWFQANGQNCVTFCSGRGMTNVPSTEGAKCTSGENIPASAIAAGITYGACFPAGCMGHLGPIPASSSGSNCYATGQNQDNDPSDVTRGCFCR